MIPPVSVEGSFRPLILILALLCTSCEPGGLSIKAAPRVGKESPAALSADVPVEVVGITDGDTITARIDGKPVKIRLHGIDAPERGQAFGTASKRALSSFLQGKRVRIVRTDVDRWGRTVAEVYTDGVRVSAALVREGMAWHFVRYAPEDSALAGAESSARARRAGLWSEPAPVAPWDFRRRPR